MAAFQKRPLCCVVVPPIVENGARLNVVAAVGLRPQAITSSYAYDGEQTCAADGMCQEKCPVKINTGDMIKVGQLKSYNAQYTAV